MNGIEFIIDTNAILYSINDNPCMAEYLDSEFGIFYHNRNGIVIIS